MTSWKNILTGALLLFLLVPVAPAHAQAPPDTTTGLVSHWTLDEGSGTTVADSTGSNNGTLEGGAAWVLGQLGSALNFDTVDDYVDLPSFDVAGNEITIAAWVNMDSFPSKVDQRFVSKATGPQENDHWWMLGDIAGSDRLRFRLKTGGNTTTLIASSAGTLSAGVWTHVAAVYDGSTMKLYKDGVEVGSTPKSGAIDTNPNVSVNLGRNPDGYTKGYLDGSLDDVRIYNRALTTEDIAALANPSPDVTPPSVSMTAPADGATVSDTIVVTADASDDTGVAGVQFTLDGVNLGAEDTSAPYSVSWNTALVANGSHTLGAVARDAAGNQTTATSITVDVSNAIDTTPPSVSMTAPADGATVSGSSVTVSASASDNVAVAGVQFYLDGALLGAEDVSSPYQISWNTTGADGAHTLFAVARDAAGNQATSTSIGVTVDNTPPPDTTPPSVPANFSAAAISSTQINLSWNASTDNVGVAGYNIYRCQGSGCTPATFITTVVSGLTYQDTGLTEEATYTYAVSAVDAAGNESALSQTAAATTLNGTTPGPVPFTTVVIDASNSGDNKAVGDFDLDGDMDGVIGGGNLTWYEWISGTTFAAHVIRSTPVYGQFTTDMQTGDVDGDGDPDIIVGDENGPNNLLWFENPKLNPPAGLNADPTVGSNWTFHVIGTHGSWVHEMEVGDINADGTLDVVTSGNGSTHVWVQNTPASWTNRDITSLAGGEGVYLGDIDRDGDLDIAVPGGWLETPSNINSGSWVKHNVSGSDGEEVMLADFNNNGRLDLMSLTATHSRGVVTWFEAPADPTSSSWVSHLINSNDGAHHPEPVDFNNDGLVDILMGLELTSWNIYINQGGAVPTFVAQQMDTASGHNARAGDLDGDGDMDIFASDWIGHPPVKVYINDGQYGPNTLPIDQWTYKEVTNSHEQTFGLAFGDMNGDGQKDIVSGGYWYRNPGADMTGAWTQFAFPSGMHAILVTDVDGDAFADVIAQKTEGSLSVYWLEATNAAGTSWSSVLTGSVPTASHTLGAQGYRIADVIAGGRPEVLISSGGGVYYLEIPASPQAGNWNVVRVNNSPSDEGFDVGDIDNDGDLDVAATTGNSKTVQWYRNPGNGSADWSTFTLGSFPEADFPDRTVLADFNGDGRLDVAVSEENGVTSDAQTYWWQAPLDPTQPNWTRSLVVSQATTNSMDTADMDNDGSPDLILGEHRGTKKVAIWQNDGNGSFVETVVDTGKESHLGVQTVDLDGDTDLDIVSIAFDAPQQIHLWRNDALASGGTPIDTTAPAAVADLALGSPTSDSLTVSWTAPGDDGASGTAASYDLRYSTSPITDLNWASATAVAGEPTPSAAGTAESMIVSGLTSNTTYYFGLKTSDEASNISTLSNVPSGATTEDPSALIAELQTLQGLYPGFASQIQTLIDELSQ